MKARAVAKVEEVAAELFGLFKHTVKLKESKKGKSAPNLEAQIGEALESFYKEAQLLRIKHGLGLINRARVIRQFQNKLLKEGYQRDLVNRVTISLILSAFVGNSK